MQYLKDIIHYFKDSDTGIGLELDPENKVAIIFTENIIIEEIFVTLSENVTFVTENIQPYEHLKSKYHSLNLVQGNIFKTNLIENSIDFILTDSGIINLDWNSARNELKRISSPNGYCDVVIIDNGINKLITDEFLEFFYAGSGYETKVFSEEGNNELIIYHNPIGFNEDELKSKEITEFLSACGDYCNVIENYSKYTIKEFLYNVQKALVYYYSKGFQLPDCCSADFTDLRGHTIKMDYENSRKYFPVYPEELSDFIGKDNFYWSNFNPYPDDNDIEVYKHNLAYDLHEIYEDIKSGLIVFNTKSIYNQQEALWQFKFDWQGHTGDHWTFAVRAIHWKLQDLEYED